MAASQGPGAPSRAAVRASPLWTLLAALLLVAGTTGGFAADGPTLRVLGPSTVDRDGDLQMEAGQDLTLECDGGEHMKWNFSYVENQAHEESLSVPHVQEEPQGRGRWRTTLRLPNATRYHTGFYNCSLASAPERPASVYVFVADPSDPWTQYNYLNYLAKQYEEVTLGCRPNNKSIQVKLLGPSHEEIPLGFNNATGSTLRWAPTVGFVLGPVTDSDGGIYMCRVEEQDFIVMMTVMPRQSNLEQPTIHAVGAVPHAVRGHAIELQCFVRSGISALYSMVWKLPEASTASAEGRLNISDSLAHYSSPADVTLGIRTGTINLTVVGVTDSDAGNYTCTVIDHNEKSFTKSFEVLVKDGSVRYIDVKTEERDLHQTVYQSMNATWTVEVEAYPPDATFSWFGPDHKQLPTAGPKTFMKTSSQGRGVLVSLTVMDADLPERGTYSLKINTVHEEKIVNLPLTVQSPPVVQMEPLVEPVQLGSERGVSCRVQASPLPTVWWEWRPCPGLLRECSPDGPHIVKVAPVSSLSDVDFNSTLTLHVNASGYLSCHARNDVDDASENASLQVTDLPGSGTLELWGPETTVEGDDLVLECGVLRENHTAWPRWRRRVHGGGDEVALDLDRMQVSRSNTSLSLRSLLRMTQLRLEDSGSYQCTPADGDGEEDDSAVYEMNVKPPRAPFPVGQPLNNTEWLVLPQDKLRLPCKFYGLPAPRVTWFKDGHPLVLPKNRDQFRLEENGTVLVLSFVTEVDQGEYRCRAENRLGRKERWAHISLRNRKGLQSGMVALISFLVLLVLVMVPLCFFVYRDWKRRRMVILALHHFTEGQPDVLNPELPADEQAELLPYDRKWEFPRERLKLGKQLGAGAFGVVLKAVAQGIVEGEEATTVAVKMVKRTADFSYLRALASELKIMVHLGRHLNVVNLLGACTGNIERQELLVIVEYCRFGNLHNYLLRHREGFVDQVDPRTGMVDASIGAERLARQDSFSQCGPGGRVKYASLSFSGSSDTTGGSDAGSECAAAPVGPVDYRAAAAAAAAAAPAVPAICVDSAGNETISMSPAGGEDAGLTSSGSAQPHWRSNYRGDYRGGVRPICTRDLLCWSYQVARGMQYLARRKVLHGDLAARNILLADGNIVKICDFGLAKSMYKSDNYKKKGDGPLPVKWMALESIRDRIFSTQSDVWSFGIVLWELFSLAQTPYPGMAADERLYSRLQDGYRMEKPPYATDDLYGVMMHCWETKPVWRPAFDELAETLGTYLEDSVRNHYLDLNNAYIDMNEQWRRDGATDYLGMLGSPDYSNLVAPRDEDDPDYINSASPAPPSPGTSSGYLLMRGGAPGGPPGSGPTTPLSAAVFSPRPASGAQVFTFEGPRAPAAAAAAAAAVASDGAAAASRPSTPNALDNPGYVQRPAVLNPSADNYVNVPKHRIAAVAAGVNGMNGVSPGSPLCAPAATFAGDAAPGATRGLPDAFSNPGYVSGAALGVGAGRHAFA